MACEGDTIQSMVFCPQSGEMHLSLKPEWAATDRKSYTVLKKEQLF